MCNKSQVKFIISNIFVFYPFVQTDEVVDTHVFRYCMSYCVTSANNYIYSFSHNSLRHFSFTLFFCSLSIFYFIFSI